MPWPLTRLDVAGAFGDIGVLFPIAIALITLNHLNPTALFLTAGLTYCLAARYFQIPIAVQPFKAVAAIALALALSPSEIASAGLLMGVLLLLVGVTNLAGWLARLFTLPIVRGIQLGSGSGAGARGPAVGDGIAERASASRRRAAPVADRPCRSRIIAGVAGFAAFPRGAGVADLGNHPGRCVARRQAARSELWPRDAAICSIRIGRAQKGPAAAGRSRNSP